ncbi:MAG: phytanoyl-CoA dioxygenase family protein [Natronospirillum sp.]|uniref:phytanoyl-CoA dioxygenase family protein n=1 Tax=Natronospirillum sp. TaxID=2812955 RepID=UPI0025FEF7DD|nr:phytanoyl-CoA dioxygenase family protein [Natronospirillum sp.]MCH8551159.1 phytanoyl-CoA dioxygenase family protein [Natronospirillum sp.]
MQTVKNRYGFGEGQPGNNSVSNTCSTQLADIRKTRPLRVLSEADWAFWQSYGYVVVRQAVAPEQVERTRSLLWEFQEMSPDDPDGWYRPQLRDHAMQELNNSGMVECYNHQVLWDNRQTPRVYDAFVDIWDREDLWVTIDRANLNPPNRSGRDFDGFIHWDANTKLDPLPVNVQGVLALSDTSPDTGGFQCVPQLFHHFGDWRSRQPSDRDPFSPGTDGGYPVEFVPMQAGDLLIFNSLLAHGIKPNRSDQVRMAQYIAMVPAEQDNEVVREWRIRSWRDRVAPEGYAFPGDPRGWEQSRYPRAELSPLGRRLLGLDQWKAST